MTVNAFQQVCDRRHISTYLEAMVEVSLVMSVTGAAAVPLFLLCFKLFYVTLYLLVGWSAPALSFYCLSLLLLSYHYQLKNRRRRSPVLLRRPEPLAVAEVGRLCSLLRTRQHTVFCATTNPVQPHQLRSRPGPQSVRCCDQLHQEEDRRRLSTTVSSAWPWASALCPWRKRQPQHFHTGPAPPRLRFSSSCNNHGQLELVRCRDWQAAWKAPSWRVSKWAVS